MEPTDYDTRLAAYAVIVVDERILLSWYVGGRRDGPGWTLPGGGVDYEEQLEEAVVREVREETGYDVVVGRPIATHCLTDPVGPHPPRPYKSVRVVFAATIVGGTLGTTEVGGTTSHAAWVPLADVPTQESRSGVVDVALAAWRNR